MYQMQLPLVTDLQELSYRDRLVYLLSHDLDFHNQDSKYSSHDFHSFPAKFPPQLPHVFIEALTEVGDLVLDPMCGSGTSLLEAFLMDRRALGFDIDPLALLLSRTKTTSLDAAEVAGKGYEILRRASERISSQGVEELGPNSRWDTRTRNFVDYWFAQGTQVELMALASEIQRIAAPDVRDFFQIVFSAIIITKSGGVSLAFDLAHTRPHRAKIVYSVDGELLLGQDLASNASARDRFLTKTLRSPLGDFEARLRQNLRSLGEMPELWGRASVAMGDAQSLPLAESSVDLIVTSPPYAANAIDYMRAHKFSLVWLGYAVGELGQRRQDYIGGDAVTGRKFEELPEGTSRVVADVASRDKSKAQVLRRYYSEMSRVLYEMYRVLKPGRAAIVVVGSSTMRGIDTLTHECLADIGIALGFDVPRIGVRRLDRNRRMMPAGAKRNARSQIENRMHEEYVIGLIKPANAA